MPGIRGTLVLAGEGTLPDDVYAGFLELAGGDSSFVVVIQRPHERRDPRSAITYFENHGLGVMAAVDQSGDDLDATDTDDLAQATGLWISAAVSLESLADQDVRALSDALEALLGRGGVIAAAGRNAEWLADSVLKDGNGDADTISGLGLLPGVIIGDHLDTPESIGRFFDEHPSHADVFTLGLGPNAALAIRRRRGRVVAEGSITIGLAPGKSRPLRVEQFDRGTTVDLIALSRAAVARAGEEFPAPEPHDPVVESGTLFIGGGGQMPEEGMQRFIEASGGPDAPIVVIPTAIGGPRAVEFGQRAATMLREAGANNVVLKHAVTPGEAERESFLEPLRTAGGIWFTGGRQWRLVDAYRGTKAHELMHEVLERGGAIGGSSAGATIQAEYMVRGHPLGNTIMMAEGYEQGLNFLPGVAIDQHFAQRDRFADLASVKHAFPQLLCLGIDEQTMLIVEDSVMEVVGPNNCAVYAEAVPDDFDGTEFVPVGPGERYDLKAKRKLEAGR